MLSYLQAVPSRAGGEKPVWREDRGREYGRYCLESGS